MFSPSPIPEGKEGSTGVHGGQQGSMWVYGGQKGMPNPAGAIILLI